MKWLRKNQILILIIVFIVLITGYFIVKQSLENKKYDDIKESNISFTSESEKVDNDFCMVDIKGAVNNPGVYTTSCTDNVSDIIRLAGGLTDEADTSVTNLAKKVTNEMVIIIYTKDEVKNSNIVDTVVKVVEQECICPNIQNDGCINDQVNNTIGSNKLININKATLEELMTIPGIGEVKAKAIINYRETKGNFKLIEDIQNVDGIGSKLYEEIKVYLTT